MKRLTAGNSERSLTCPVFGKNAGTLFIYSLYESPKHIMSSISSTKSAPEVIRDFKTILIPSKESKTERTTLTPNTGFAQDLRYSSSGTARNESQKERNGMKRGGGKPSPLPQNESFALRMAPRKSSSLSNIVPPSPSP